MNFVDNCAQSAQYLAVADYCIRYFVGDLLLGPEKLARENRSRRKLHASKEESGKEKETLSRC